MTNSNENIIETELNTETDAQELIKMVKKEIKQNLNKIEQIHSIILFGSLARLEITDDSDIDICILLKEGAEKPLEDEIFDHFLDIGKKIHRNIQCVFLSPKELDQWDGNFLENIIAEGKLLYGANDYLKLLINKIELEPFQIVVLKLIDIPNSDKMRLKRILYGYTSKKKYENKVYKYNKKGLVQKYNGQKLGRGAFIIPEEFFPSIRKELEEFKNIRYRNFRTWMQRI